VEKDSEDLVLKMHHVLKRINNKVYQNGKDEVCKDESELYDAVCIRVY